MKGWEKSKKLDKSYHAGLQSHQMEATKDMVNQERGGRIFGVIPTRERTAPPVLPRPDVRPTPVSPEPGRGKEKKGVGRKARIALAGLAALGTVETTGAIVNEQVNEQPVSTQSVIEDLKWPWNLGKSAAEDISGMLHKEPPSVFDNSETKGKISSANILSVPREVFDKTPLADENGAPIFDFPWDNNNPAEIQYTKSLYPRPDWWERSGADVDPNTEIKNNFEATSTLPAGFEFPAPYPGRVFFAGFVYNEEASSKSPSNPYGLAVHDGPPKMAKIEFIAPNGILYFINIGIDNDKGSVPLEPLVDAPLISLENSNGTDWEKGALVERGQKIFRLKQKGKLGMYIEGGKNGNLRLPKDRIPGNFQFQTQKDSNGVEKLLVSEPK